MDVKKKASLQLEYNCTLTLRPGCLFWPQKLGLLAKTYTGKGPRIPWMIEILPGIRRLWRRHRLRQSTLLAGVRCVWVSLPLKIPMYNPRWSYNHLQKKGWSFIYPRTICFCYLSSVKKVSWGNKEVYMYMVWFYNICCEIQKSMRLFV